MQEDEKRLLLFGGSFDPPHVGHMNLLHNAVRAIGPDVVVVMPSGTSPHKATSATPWALRAAMCACFRRVFPALVISDLEERRQGKSYTIDTLQSLGQAYPGHALYLCIGGDMLESFGEWHRWQEILPLATLVVTGRKPGQETALRAVASRLEQAGGCVVFADGPVVDASSSEIRRGIATGQDVWALIPPPADQIVREHHLYVPGA